MGKAIRVLLLQAPVPGPQNRMVAKSSAIPPLGLGYLASVLIQEGHEVMIVDMDMEDTGPGELRRILETFAPAIIGISTTTLTFKNALRVAKVTKEQHPTGIVCIGGPHATVCHEDTLRHPFVDVVVRGEGEMTFRELCNYVAEGKRLPADIQGTSWRSDGGIKVCPARERMNDLDSLPFPARHLMPLNEYNIPGTVLTSRGCPFACGFCAGPATLGRKYTHRTARNVVDEVQMCIDMFYLTSFYFLDDTMTHHPRRVFEICGELRKLKLPASVTREIKWTCESRADVVNPEMLREMQMSGCTTIQFGMESGSQELLDQLGKKVSVDQIEQAVVWSREAGISPVLSMVFPHPNETDETFRQTLDFIRRLYDKGVEKIIPALLTLFPGTRFYDQRESLGLTMLTDDTDEFNLGTPVLVTKNFNENKIKHYYSQLLMLTQLQGGDAISGLSAKYKIETLI